MAWDYYSRRLSRRLSDFIGDYGDRWSDAMTKISDGTYTGAEMQTDVQDTLRGMLGVWTALWGVTPSPLVPVAKREEKAADMTTKETHALAFLPAPLEASQIPSVSELAKWDDPTKKLDNPANAGDVVNVGTASPERDQIEVSVPKQAAAPDPGTYHGVVEIDGKIVALVLIKVKS